MVADDSACNKDGGRRKLTFAPRFTPLRVPCSPLTVHELPSVVEPQCGADAEAPEETEGDEGSSLVARTTAESSAHVWAKPD